MNTFLSNLPNIVTRRKKRLGRGLGSGKGAKSGRGTTRHQKARESIPLAFEGGQVRNIKKYPLLRGRGRNKPLLSKPLIVTLDDLNMFNDNETVTIETLVNKGVIVKQEKYMRVKVLTSGTLKKKLTVQLPVSKSAKKIIEELGGQVQVV